MAAENLPFDLDLVETVCNRPFLSEKLEIARDAVALVEDDWAFARLLNQFYRVSAEDARLLDWITETTFEPALTLVKYLISLVFYGTNATDLRGYMLGILEMYASRVMQQMTANAGGATCQTLQ